MKVKCEEIACICEYIIRIVPLQVDTSFQNLIFFLSARNFSQCLYVFGRTREVSVSRSNSSL